jgi:hypothetical protein
MRAATREIRISNMASVLVISIYLSVPPGKLAYCRT